MAGIYLHIPFCVQRCHYCDFFSSTRLEMREQFVQACLKEIMIRKEYLQDEESDTIYMGGGTPSLLDPDSLSRIIDSLYKHLKISPHAELTIEANPDDLDAKVLKDLISVGFNRISLGIQSFRDADLILMNRRHSADQAIDSVHQAKSAGFENISIDLIYGIPGLSELDWKDNMYRIRELPVDHLSAYHLTFEKETAFGKWLKQGKMKEIAEESSFNQYQLLSKISKELGFEQYEISSFAKNQRYSLHNRKYWNGEWYLGLGPSAHSYNGESRHWNPSDLKQYLEGYLSGMIITEKEDISINDRRNELIMTSLRTKWGIKKSDWEKLDHPQSWTQLKEQGRKYLDSKDLICEDERLVINPESWFRADGIIADLFRVDAL